MWRRSLPRIISRDQTADAVGECAEDFDPRDDADPRDREDFDIYDARWLDDPRDLDDRERDVDRDLDARDPDPREPFIAAVELPHGLERELVQDDHENVYELNGEDSRMLATIGAFRMVAERDLETVRDPDWDPRDDTLEHLRDEGLIRFVAITRGDGAVVLTSDGRDLLDSHRREPDGGHARQEFHAGVSHPREVPHDSELFEAYLAVQERLRDQGAEIERVVWNRISGASTRSGCRSATRTTRQVTDGQIATHARSRTGPEHITSRTSTTESTSQTSASSTSWTAATDTRTSKS